MIGEIGNFKMKKLLLVLIRKIKESCTIVVLSLIGKEKRELLSSLFI